MKRITKAIAKAVINLNYSSQQQTVMTTFTWTEWLTFWRFLRQICSS